MKAIPSLIAGTAGVECPSEETLTWDNGTGKAKVKLAEKRMLPQEEAIF